MDNAIQQEALEIVKEGHNVYIGGQAGCGKSFVVQEIFRWATALEKNVWLTCTTGIACSVFPNKMNPMTIHKWAGLSDCRFSKEHLYELIKDDDRYYDAKQRIIGTDMLIIDEVSMMSKRTFEMLEYVLRLKDPGHRFGGIQVILVGDFMQLPPVRNKRYGDEGEFCFTSSFFPPHSIILEEIMRQSDGQLIKCIRELSKGSCSEDSLELLEQLSRPLSNTMPIKLYTTNILVDMFNRDQLLEKPGEVYVFDSVDIGDVKHLEELTVQPTISSQSLILKPLWCHCDLYSNKTYLMPYILFYLIL